MTNKEIQIIKEEILHYLSDDWNNHKRGRAHKENQALFDRKQGYCKFCNIELEDVMDKVVKGLYAGTDKINKMKGE